MVPAVSCPEPHLIDDLRGCGHHILRVPSRTSHSTEGVELTGFPRSTSFLGESGFTKSGRPSKIDSLWKSGVPTAETPYITSLRTHTDLTTRMCKDSGLANNARTCQDPDRKVGDTGVSEATYQSNAFCEGYQGRRERWDAEREFKRDLVIRRVNPRASDIFSYEHCRFLYRLGLPYAVVLRGAFM